jgi:hypothetical protein
MTRPKIILLLRAFVAAGTSLPSRCLAKKGGMHFTEPLSSNDRRNTHNRHTDCWEEFMKYAIEIGSGAMMYIPSLVNIGSGFKS